MSIRRTISVIVLNEHGVLARISGLFAGRGYNIDTLTVAPIPESNFSRLSIVTNTNENYIVVMVADDASRVESFLKSIKKFNPVDVVRGGSVIMDI